MEVVFFGGPYDGRPEVVPAYEDSLIGQVPTEVRMHRLPPPEFLRYDPSGLMPQRLVYERQHRGGRWAYVFCDADPDDLLHVPPLTDPLLEAVVAHVRKVWPQQRVIVRSHAVDHQARIECGANLEKRVRSWVLHQLHEAAAEEDLMLLAVDGPTWAPTNSDYMDKLLVSACAIPRFRPLTQRLSEEAARRA
jgi:hypothetical protein